MKHAHTPIGAVAMFFALGTAGAHGATISQTFWNNDWNTAMWGSPAAAPASGNDYVTAVGGNNIVRLSANGSSFTFGGDSLTIASGTIVVIPEPSAAVLGLAALSACFLLRKRA